MSMRNRRLQEPDLQRNLKQTNRNFAFDSFSLSSSSQACGSPPSTSSQRGNSTKNSPQGHSEQEGTAQHLRAKQTLVLDLSLGVSILVCAQQLLVCDCFSCRRVYPLCGHAKAWGRCRWGGWALGLRPSWKVARAPMASPKETRDYLERSCG